MKSICGLLALTSVLLLIWQIRNMRALYREWKRMKQWYDRGACAHDTFMNQERDVSGSILLCIFFTLLTIFFTFILYSAR